ncbi:Crp/Fnr family transcriptional regulator [Clostridium aminobutyricum]|uniref:Crp/Fnr family transcriptional regulator n=1 Tax=Clostridium aminobutyricum TaxID=33953 RepID=A0A939IHT1_CLOAM|nr:Crp/Fnr family transcriptional regulator [Clostridium aminobutyricum]MBN7772361.1 Crp/Fnr family transcriptional regulator [Clostridium aminobutyricum]
MKNIYEELTKSPLFGGIEPEDISAMLACLSAQTKNFKKNQNVFMIGDKNEAVGFIVSGSIQIIKEDFLGNRSIIAQIGQGQIFAEAFACAGIKRMPVSVVATTDSKILFIDYNRIVHSCTNTCAFHHRLIENMLQILAQKNVYLNDKIEHLSRRSTKDKVLSYLSSQAQKMGKKNFEIPFNRQELADYLCVDRSALSNELCKLRDMGILDFNRNQFTLLETYEEENYKN